MKLDLRSIVRGNAFVPVLAVFASLIVGGVLIALSNQEVLDSSANIFSDPGNFLLELGKCHLRGLRRTFPRFGVQLPSR